MEFRLLEQKKDQNGSPVFNYQVILEGQKGGKGTGYSKKEDKLATHTYYELWPVVDLINKLAGKEIVNEKDLKFDVMSRASHNGAEIIDKDP